MTHPFQIRQAAVIGSGTMGSGIAALLAGIGIPVILLDLPAPDTTPDDPLEQRNKIVLKNLRTLQKSRPAQVYHVRDLDLITPGNLDDDFELLANADWIIEAVVEKLSVKQELMARIETVRKPDALVSTNTSGLSIAAIAEECSADFQPYFLGTHFFNPPRYLKLLELIPHPHTDPAVIEFMERFATNRLGKGVVICKDTPNFIANRFISIVGTFALTYALDNGYTVGEVDNLTGPLIGRPKSATFRLLDLIGIDVMAHVNANLYPAIPDDEARDVLRHPRVNTITRHLVENGWLGNKTHQGFYKRVETEDGGRDFWQLNLATLEYQPPQRVRFASVGAYRQIEDPGERIKALINSADRAGEYLWHLHAFYLTYAAHRLGEIADSILAIDNANKWGFNHEMGPFEIWDALGVEETLPHFEQAGYPAPGWVMDMVICGYPTFYQRDEHGTVTGVYDPEAGDYVPLPVDPRAVVIRDLRAAGKRIEGMAGASLIDMGDGVALFEFHTKANAIDDDVIKVGWRALERLETDFDGLVVGNQGTYFSAGANILLILMLAQQGEFDQIETAIRQIQDLFQALRYAPKPVVTAPFNMTLAGGAEFAMAGARAVAHVDLFMGLVEMGVGLLPAGTGCKELLRRRLNPVMETPNADPLPHLQAILEQIALATVSDSAQQARALGYLRPYDRILMNQDHLLFEAKREALHLYESGYTPLPPGKIWAAGRDGLAALRMMIYTLQEGGFATAHDAKIADHIAYVLCGGDLSEPGWVPEQYILDLELAAFIELCHEPKTHERIRHMLETNKPLRN